MPAACGGGSATQATGVSSLPGERPIPAGPASQRARAAIVRAAGGCYPVLTGSCRSACQVSGPVSPVVGIPLRSWKSRRFAAVS